MVTLIAFILLTFQLAPPRKPSRPAKPPQPTLDQRVVSTVQKLSARLLDPELPDQPFAEWLQSVVGKDAKVAWESNDCGEQTGDPKTTPADFPICGQASAKLPGARIVTVMIAVGSSKTGIGGTPAVFFVGLDVESTFETVKSLHDLSGAIAGTTSQP